MNNYLGKILDWKTDNIANQYDDFCLVLRLYCLDNFNRHQYLNVGFHCDILWANARLMVSDATNARFKMGLKKMSHRNGASLRSRHFNLLHLVSILDNYLCFKEVLSCFKIMLHFATTNLTGTFKEFWYSARPWTRLSNTNNEPTR
jgi:hypothetical protein